MKNKDLDRSAVKFLRSLAHDLKPVVRLGQHGLTEAVTRELDIALTRHELVKVKLAADTREARAEQLAALASATRGTVIQSIGHTGTLYRPHPDTPRIDLKARG